VNTKFGVERTVRYAFELAANRERKKLTLVHKHNVLVNAGWLWQRTVDEVAKEFPAVSVDYEGLQNYLFPGAEIGPFGVVRSVHLSQSTDNGRNMKASSGGLIKELLRHLLSNNHIDAVIALDHVDGIEFAARLVTSPDDVDTLPGSIYHNLKQTPALQLLRDTPGRLAVVAIPCQLEGLYAWVKQQEPELRQKISITIGLLCGWQYSHHSINAMGEYLGYNPEEIADISYRGGGPVGKLTVTTRDGEVYTASRRVDFWLSSGI